MSIERILITVKTYPTLSRKYGELVCTAGIKPDGNWVRLYPIPFRRLDEPEQFSKFDWIEADLVKNQSDPRPETYRLLNMNNLHVVDHVRTGNGWRERRHLILQNTTVYTRLQTLIEEAKSNTTSLAVFKPTKIIGFEWEEEEREWDTTKIEEIRKQTHQGELFPEEAWRQTFKIIPKYHTVSFIISKMSRAKRVGCKCLIGKWGPFSGIACETLVATNNWH